MNITGAIITVFLAVLLGWMIARMAIQLIFHPRKPIRFFGITFYGIFPKNQQLIAQQLGRAVTSEFISFDAIAEKITHPDNVEKLRPDIEQHIDQFLRHKLKETFPMLGMMMGEKTINQLKGAFLTELDILFPVVMKSYLDNMQQDLDLGKIVTEKVAGFPSERLEEMLYKFAYKEFKLYELAGAVAGLLIGLLQVLFLFITH